MAMDQQVDVDKQLIQAKIIKVGDDCRSFSVGELVALPQ